MASLHLAQEIFKLIYPVGSIYMSVNNTNPGTLFGGTWERIAQGRTLMGEGVVQANSDNWCGTTAKGAWTAHAGNMGGSTINTHNHYTGISYDGSSLFISGSKNLPRSRVETKDRCTPWSGGSGNAITREDSTYNETIYIMPPYLVVYIWKRKA